MIDLPVIVASDVKPRKPDWLRVKLPVGKEYAHVRSLVDEHKLHTICESGNCPNMGECWGAGTATFMILGNICTRSCSFCAVATGRPLAVDTDEPNRVANSIKLMNVKHAVITSVDRDDLKDGGSIIWAQTIIAIRQQSPITTMETLIPDFKGVWENLYRVCEQKPEIISHNIETVKRLTKEVRIQAKYERSMECLKRVSDYGIRTKSGIMLGFGETEADIIETMTDLKQAGVHVLTLGQYLQPTKNHHPVINWVHPDEFLHYKNIGLKMGFKYVESGPLVRSSYHAEKHLLDN
ncbi:MAG: lipoyl synthase [Sphingobacteriales bacterium]|jgi:lipoic acid synthetase|nr:MAG: lipoyl synthase [Sphingobacteriales bacterium]